MNNAPTDQSRQAVAWAAGTLKLLGCELLPFDHAGWDVFLPNGSWRTAADWRELCDIAHSLQDSRGTGPFITSKQPVHQ